MNIYREVVNRIEIPALPSLENGYYLLRFERNGTTSNVYAVVENESGMGVPITASVTEIGTGTPDPEAGEVLLAPGAWTLFFYEQVSGTNTNPDCSTIPLGQTEVTVYGEDAAVLSQTPTACPSGPGGGITSVNSDTGPAVQLDAVDIPSTPFVSLQAGTFPGAYRDTGFTVEGAPIYKLVGAAGDPDDGLNSIFRQTPTSWVISNATGLEMYNGTGADLLTATWTNTGDGALPLPFLVGISATQVQAAVEEVATVRALSASTVLTYTGGSVVNSTTTLSDIHSSAGFTIPAAGEYDYEFIITYDAAATTTGIRLAVNGTATFSYLSGLIAAGVQQTDRSTFNFVAYETGGLFPSSGNTSGNFGLIRGTIIATAAGTFVPRFCSEVGASAITVTNVIGRLKRTA